LKFQELLYTSPSFLAGVNKYAANDKKYMIDAIPITTSKFGPSGSLKRKNIALEHAMDVIPKISNEVLFDLKYISVTI
jgi:hypothetical protein